MSLLRQGHNCWKTGRPHHAGLLLDGEEYFANLYDNMGKAEYSICILGWDIHSQIALLRGGEQKGDRPVRLLPYLTYLAERNKDLNIYILCWDYSSLFVLSREAFQRIKLSWLSHERIHFVFDGQHPIGACHHQKIVVIDDSIAYCGGIDLTAHRWDTHTHDPAHPLRRDPSGKTYPPFHDIQAAVDGEPARRLGHYFRKRWKRVTGNVIEPVHSSASNRKGFDCGPHPLGGCMAGISRTEPFYKKYREVREVENLYLDLIQQAEQYIYMENQYLTSDSIAGALRERLQDSSSPEIVIIIPKEYDGWIENHSLKINRQKILRELEQSDRYGKMSIYYPENRQLSGCITVHSKLTVADDVYVRIGSSNLSNRSMGFDTECDLVFEREEDTGFSSSVRSSIYCLLEGYTGTPVSEIRDVFSEKPLWRDCIDKINRKDRFLKKIEPEGDPSLAERLVPSVEVADPAGPMGLEASIEDMVYNKTPRFLTSISLKKYILYGFYILLLCVAAAGLWNLVGFYRGAGGRFIRDLISRFAESPVSIPLVLLVFVTGSLIFIPVTFLLVLVATIFDPLTAFFLNLSGTVANASAGYLVGLVLGTGILKKYFPAASEWAEKGLSNRGVIAVLLMRMVPLAHFSVVNFIAGAGRIRYLNFIGGTLLGILPGVVSLLLFQKSFIHLIESPDWGGAVQLGLVITAVFLFFILVRKWLSRYREKVENTG